MEALYEIGDDMAREALKNAEPKQNSKELVILIRESLRRWKTS
jgi:hypothetical protein